MRRWHVSSCLSREKLQLHHIQAHGSVRTEVPLVLWGGGQRSEASVPCSSRCPAGTHSTSSPTCFLFQQINVKCHNHLNTRKKAVKNVTSVWKVCCQASMWALVNISGTLSAILANGKAKNNFSCRRLNNFLWFKMRQLNFTSMWIWTPDLNLSILQEYHAPVELFISFIMYHVLVMCGHVSVARRVRKAQAMKPFNGLTTGRRYWIFDLSIAVSMLRDFLQT